MTERVLASAKRDDDQPEAADRREILDALERGDISPEEAIRKLEE